MSNSKRSPVLRGVLLLTLAAVVALLLAPPGTASAAENRGEYYAVVLQGSCEERGKQYGEQAKELIAANIELFIEAAGGQGLSPAEIFTRGREYEQVLLQEAPCMAAEIRKLAEVCGLSYEVLLAYNLLEEEITAQGCTTMLAAGAATRKGKAYFHKNRDATRGSAQVVLQVDPDEGYKYIGITSAGSSSIAMGINEWGVSTGNNVLSTWDTGPGFGNLTINRMVLENAASAREAVELIEMWPRRGGSNFPVADTQEGAFVETTHSVIGVMWVIDDAKAHTNHYIIEGMESYDTIDDPRNQRWSWYVSSRERLERANELLQRDWGDLTERHLIAISEDQTDEPSVYWIDSQAVIDGREMGSISSGTFDDAKLRMWSQLGQPSLVPEIPLWVHMPLIPGPFAGKHIAE